MPREDASQLVRVGPAFWRRDSFARVSHLLGVLRVAGQADPEFAERLSDRGIGQRTHLSFSLRA